MTTKKDKAKRKIIYTKAKEVVEKQESGFTPTSFTLPDGMELFRFKKEGTYRLNIIPYVVGEGNPAADKGVVHYERTYYAHGQVGPNNRSYCCSAMTFGKPCPICEYHAKLRKTPGVTDKQLNAVKAKRRQLWLVQDLDSDDKAIQLMEAAYYMSFGEMLNNKIDAADEDDTYINFFHLEDGMTLKVKVKEATFESNKYMKVMNIEIVPRKIQLDESLLEEVPCLDELPKEISYKELAKIFDQGEHEEESEEEEDSDEKRQRVKDKKEEDEEEPEEEEEKPVKKVRGKKQEEPEEEEESEEEVTAESKGIEKGSKVIHEDFGRCTVVHVSGDGTSLRLQDEDDEIHKAINPSDCELEEEELEEEETPKKKSGKKKKDEEWEEPEEEEDSDDDEDSEEEDEETDEDETEEDSDDDDEGEEAPAPKKRGRPRK